MKTRVIIEYNLPAGDCVALREREEQRWTASETVLSLPGSAMVKVEFLEGPNNENFRPLLPAMYRKPEHTLSPKTLGGSTMSDLTYKTDPHFQPIWDIYPAVSAIRLGEVEAVDEREAVEKAAEKF